MRRILALTLLLTSFAGIARAEGDRAGAFDYYVLALSWSPAWCAAEGDARGAPQCAEGSGLGFTLHGLWPQHERGWPDHCRTDARDPSRAETAAMADIMGSAGLAWRQWRKHGTCSGLSASDYFAVSRRAYEAVARPVILRKIDRPLRVAPAVIETAFLEANPDLEPDGVTITCRDGRIREARICLTRSLAPRPCGADVRRDCTGSAEFSPLR